MSTPVIDGCLFAWKKNLDYGQKLVADLEEAQMVSQPAENPDSPSNHPAWVLSHLNVYVPIVGAIIKNEAFEDPKEHEFGMLSKPQANRDVYASKEELIANFVQGHETVIELLGNADDSIFANPVKLPRWANVMPIAGVALPYLMFNHENIHLGQVSAWRRIQGMPSV
jgi:hypothetical protein